MLTGADGVFRAAWQVVGNEGPMGADRASVSSLRIPAGACVHASFGREVGSELAARRGVAIPFRETAFAPACLYFLLFQTGFRCTPVVSRHSIV